jgi:hypothetical protein
MHRKAGTVDRDVAHRLDLAGHRRRNGVVPWIAYHGEDGRTRLLAAAEAAGLPVAAELHAARWRVPVVVADPLGHPALLTLSPHLVLDGLQLAAHAVGAREAVVRLPADDRALPSVAAALTERADRVPVRVHPGEVAAALVCDTGTLAQLALAVLLGPHHYRAARTDFVAAG